MQWTTSGDGFFETPNSPGSIYIPGSNDLLSGIVSVTLSASPIAPCLTGSASTTQISITTAPSISLGLPASSCSGSTIPVNANASSYQSLTWSSSGNGFFEDPFSSKTKYTPGPLDITNGSVTFILIALGSNQCNGFFTSGSTTIIPDPAVHAGNDQSICINSNVAVDASATNYSSVEWTSDGDGTFLNASALSTIYIPGQGDYNNGMVNLFVLVNGVSSCSTAATDAFTVHFIAPATADAGPDQDIVAGQQVMMQGLTENDSLHHWTTSGDGAFNNATLLNAVYTPGLNDLAMGAVTLGLNATSMLPCFSSTVNFVTINIFPDALLAIKFYIQGYYSNGVMVPVLFNAGVSMNSYVADVYKIQLNDTVVPFAVLFEDNIPLYTNGLSFVSIPANLAGRSCYLSLYTRNGIETWSKFPYRISAFGLYDFTSGSNP